MSDFENFDSEKANAGVGDVREWCFHQLESAVKKLIEKVCVISYTRSPEALADAARHCDQLEAVMTACEFQLQVHCASSQEHEEALSQLLMVEAAKLLGDARALIQVPLEPVYRDDNVIELQRNYTEITDAAFERLLASSDIPQFLSTPDNWPEDSAETAVNKVSPEKPALKLVYSKN
jgi:hypothetical protein